MSTPPRKPKGPPALTRHQGAHEERKAAIEQEKHEKWLSNKKNGIPTDPNDNVKYELRTFNPEYFGPPNPRREVPNTSGYAARWAELMRTPNRPTRRNQPPRVHHKGGKRKRRATRKRSKRRV